MVTELEPVNGNNVFSKLIRKLQIVKKNAHFIGICKPGNCCQALLFPVLRLFFSYHETIVL